MSTSTSRAQTAARLGVTGAALVFILQAACSLNRPGINAGELAWGPVKAALYSLLFSLRAPHVWNLRWPMLVAGAATVAAGCFLARRMAGPWGLATACVLFATDPGLIFSSRLDSADLALPRFALLLSLVLLLRFWKSASRIHLAAGFFAAGLASTNSASLPVLGAIGIAGLIALRPELRAVAGWRNIWPAATGFLAGLLPLTWHRATAPFRTAPANPLHVLDGSAWFAFAVRNQPGTWGVGARTWAEQRTLSFARAFGSPRHDMIGVALLAAAIAAGIFLARSNANRRALRFGLAVPICGYLAIAATGSHAPRAWCLLTPFATIAIAIVLGALASHSLFGTVAAIGSITVLALSNLAVTATFYSNALLYGGVPAWTEATYNLADDLDVRDARDLCVLDPATAAVLQFLLQGHAHLIAPPAPENALYIASTDRESVGRANELASATRRQINVVRYIQDFQGRSVFVLYRME